MFGNNLESARPVFQAVATIDGMARQDQLSSSACKPLGKFSFCVDHHTFFYRFRTGSEGFYPTFDLYKTEAAGGSSFFLFLDGTEIRNVDAVLQSSEEDLLSLGSFNFLTIDGKGYFFHISNAPHPHPLPRGERGRARENKFFSSPPPTPRLRVVPTSPLPTGRQASKGEGSEGFTLALAVDQGATV